MKAKWTTLFRAVPAPVAAAAEVPIGRSSHSVNVVSGHKVLVFSGEQKPRVPIGVNAANNHAGFECFDLLRRVWLPCASTNTSPVPPPPRVGHATAQIGNTVYVFGGRGGADMAPLDSDLFAFDADSNLWKVAAKKDAVNAPPARSYHAMAASATHVFVFGGCPASGRLNDLTVFNPTTGMWTIVPPHPDLSPRGGGSLACVGSRLVLFGGFNGCELGDMYVLNASSNIPESQYAWQRIDAGSEIMSPMTWPGKRSVAGFVALPSLDSIALFHGERDPSEKGHEGAGEYNDDVWVFKFTSSVDAPAQTGAWERCIDDSEKGQAPAGRGWIAAAGWQGDTVVMVGGFDGTTRDNGVYLLEFTS
ncbi:hypothetical protein BC830DRAFT_883014 [Chytriomyces sp. MP71]|nr:hypothetical protein BC830DRAFT_883014 [Chytriomyces sp. MP71]